MGQQNTPSLRAAIYVRVSTEEQTRGYGIDAQIEGCTEYCQRKGWAAVEIYPDEGVSGALTSRPGLDRLMADAEAGKFDVVVVHKYSRIGRVGRAFWRYIWALEDVEVGFTSATQEIIDTTTPTGKAQLQMYAMFAEMDYNTIRDQFQDGIQAKARQGGWPGGAPPYGYRIEGKGKRGSYLVVDEHESAILRAAWRMTVEDGLNTREVAARLNADELFTRSGKPWSHGNLRNKLVSEATTNARVIFRNPDSPYARSKNSHGCRLDRNGQPKYGDTVTIPLPPIFTPEQVTELRRALGRTSTGTPQAKPHGYPLSKRLFGECGQHYTGLKRSGRAGRWYRCSGRTERFPGAPVCSCDPVDADAVEAAVWGDVVALLGDPARLKAMAAEWVGMTAGDQATHADRIAELDRKISETTDALTKTVTEYARAGMPAVAVEAATRALTDDLKQLQSMRDEAEAWQAESEAAEQRARDLEALAGVARDRLADMDPTEQAEVLALLDVRVTITGAVPPPRLGLACSLADWFKDSGRLVPDALTDEAWATVEPIVKAWEPPNHRLRCGRVMLDAMFYKARTGVRWSELPAEFGAWKGIHSRYKTWRACGVWADVMATLPDAGSPVWTPPLVPPLKVEGRVDPRALADVPERAEPSRIGVPTPMYGGSALAPIRFRVLITAA